MLTASHPETDGQTDFVNLMLEDARRSNSTSFTSWRDFLWESSEHTMPFMSRQI